MELAIKTMIRIAAAFCAAASVAGTTCAAAQTLSDTSQIIIRWKKVASPASNDAAAARLVSDMQARMGVSIRKMRVLATGGEVMRLDRTLSAAELRDLLGGFSSSSLVEYAHEDRWLQPAILTGFGIRPGAPPNDPEFAQQWHHFESIAGMNTQFAWDLSAGTSINIALIDTGVRRHADIAANLVGGYDFISDSFIANDGDGRDADPQDPGDFTTPGTCTPGNPGSSSTWHGTMMAGALAAQTNNAFGIAGVAFDARVVPVRAIGRCGGRVSDVAEAAIWAAGGTIPGVPANPNRARVINLSLASPALCDATAQGAINIIRSLGAVIVAAAANDNSNASGSLPANCAGVIAVAAVARDGGKAPYSNFGALVDIAAPGGDLITGQANGILTTFNAGTTNPGADTLVFGQGTSLSTALVSGTAALMLARNPSLTANELEALLKSTTNPFPRTCSLCGTGIVNAVNAVGAAIRMGEIISAPTGGELLPATSP